MCRGRPELLSEVRRRWKAFRLVDRSLAALFPDPESPPVTDTTVAVPHSADLPQVPGYQVEGEPMLTLRVRGGLPMTVQDESAGTHRA